MHVMPFLLIACRTPDTELTTSRMVRQGQAQKDHGDWPHVVPQERVAPLQERFPRGPDREATRRPHQGLIVFLTVTNKQNIHATLNNHDMMHQSSFLYFLHYAVY